MYIRREVPGGEVQHGLTRVFVHPSSINFVEQEYKCPYLVYVGRVARGLTVDHGGEHQQDLYQRFHGGDALCDPAVRRTHRCAALAGNHLRGQVDRVLGARACGRADQGTARLHGPSAPREVQSARGIDCERPRDGRHLQTTNNEWDLACFQQKGNSTQLPLLVPHSLTRA